MAAKLASVLVGIALASSMLAGCGLSPVASVSNSSHGAVQAKDYYSVTRAQQAASNTLYSYNDLRDQWLRAYSDEQKDSIEDQMLVVLSQGIGDVRAAVGAEAGASGYDASQVFNIADSAISQYESLRYQWSNTHDLNQQRWISNQMQTLLVGALQDVQNVRPGSPYLPMPKPKANVQPTDGSRPTPPQPELKKK